jgi:hypothetical protein
MRIAPEESVVLNSANSAPFLILVEVYSVLDKVIATKDSSPTSPSAIDNRPPILELVVGEGRMSPQEYHQQRGLSS